MMDLRHSHATRFGSVICLRVASPRLVTWDHVESWERETLELAQRLQPRVLLIDLGRVRRCSKEAVNALLQIQRQLGTVACRLELCGLSPPVADVFQVLKMQNNVFRIHPTLREALDMDRWNNPPGLPCFEVEAASNKAPCPPDQA